MTQKVKIFKGDFDLESVIEKESPSINDSFYTCDLSNVIQKYRDWCREMPRVIIHYAIKCNNNENVLKILAALGSSFDCATKGEIEEILALNVDPDRIIFANTTKYLCHIEYAREKGVRKMTFDNEEELHKIKALYPDAE
jgi:ornithine decarboxylase